MTGSSLMTARWILHGRAAVVACLLLSLAVLALAPDHGAASPWHGTPTAQILDKQRARNKALAPARAELARKRAERERGRAEAAKAPKAGDRKNSEPAKGGPPPVGDYGDATPLDLPDDVQAGSARAATGGGGSLGRLFVSLMVVVGLIYGLTALLRRMRNGATGGAGGRSQGLRAVASIPLGPNRSIHLVRAGQEYLLVGAAEHGVVPLRTYSEQEARDAGLLDLDRRNAAAAAAARQADAEPEADRGPRLAKAMATARAQNGAGWSRFVDDLRARTVRR
jgi:flagellar biosynthetic protein FliO